MNSQNITPRQTSRKAVTAGIMICMYLSAMEATVVTTAMPTIITSLGGLEIYSWVFSIYLLSSTVSIPVWGRLSDLYGRRRLYLAGIGIFLLGSGLCGLSNSMAQLILFRALQGLGAGAVGTLSLTVVGELYTFKERGRMQGLFSGIWGFASITGPMLGGFITDHSSWQWVFFINVPLGLVAASIIRIYLMDPVLAPHEDRAGIRRGILLALAIGAFLLYLMEGSKDNHWLDRQYVGLLLLSVLLISCYLLLDRRSKRPFVPPQLFSNRTFVAASVNGVCIGMVLFGTLAFVPLFAQAVLGSTATGAGSFITPLLLTWVFLSIIMGRVLHRTGFQIPVFCGMLLLILGTVLLAGFRDAPSPKTLILAMISLGAGMGFNALPMLLAVQSAVPRELLGIATSATQFFRSIGGAVGVAVMGSRFSSVVSGVLRGSDHQDLAALLRNPQSLLRAGPGLDNAGAKLAHDIFASGLYSAFFMAFAFSLAGFLSAFLVPHKVVLLQPTATEPEIQPPAL